MQFDDPAMPYASRPDLSIDLPFARYDHLARVDEWIAELAWRLWMKVKVGLKYLLTYQM